jgi:hypothetical protein
MKNKNHKNNKPQKFIVDDPLLVLWLKIMNPFLPKKVKIFKTKEKMASHSFVKRRTKICIKSYCHKLKQNIFHN